MSLLIGKPAPNFKGTAVVGGDAHLLHPENAFKEISLNDYKGQWLVLFFYPLDFTFVCPTEIEDFGRAYKKFKEMNCEVLSCSTDSHFSHLAWRSSHPGLRHLPYPMLADFTGNISRSFEILKEEEGYALRGTYIINPEGELVYSVIQPEAVGRNTEEIIRVLAAIQSGKLTPCNWHAGEDTLN